MLTSSWVAGSSKFWMQHPVRLSKQWFYSVLVDSKIDLDLLDFQKLEKKKLLPAWVFFYLYDRTSRTQYSIIQ